MTTSLQELLNVYAVVVISVQIIVLAELTISLAVLMDVNELNVTETEELLKIHN
jgi:hypothetical protein